MIEKIEDFFAKGCGRCARFDSPECSARRWAAGLEELRRICLGSGLEETVKWGHPCYVEAGRNVALIGALREDFRLSFFNAALLEDRAGVLLKPGPNTRHADTMRFTDAAEVIAMEPVIRAYLEEAAGHARAGRRPPREAGEIELPDELVGALDSDPELSEAFAGLTPGRQRSYVIALGSTQSPDTRNRRIAKFREKIIAGKGAMER